MRGLQACLLSGLLLLSACATTPKPSYDKEEIRRVILSELKAIRKCYEPELAKNPGLHGKLVMRWDIEESGKTSKVTVKSVDKELESKPLTDCITALLAASVFAPPPKGQVVTVYAYPFFFSN
jgi:hypothetical protein